jgi:D-alanine-D-alanine ligase
MTYVRRKKEKMPKNQTKPNWRVAVLANTKDNNLPLIPDLPPDAYGDFDSIETIHLIQSAIEKDGHETTFITANENLPYALKEFDPDICFNYAEGIWGDAREAQTPALLEMFRIPYSGSRLLTNGIALDKTLTKRIWRDQGLLVAPFQEFITGKETLFPELQFPLFIKPAREGTGMGIDDNSTVMDEGEMRERVMYIISAYKQPDLVETFLPGNEYTIGQIGGPYAKRFSRHPEWYDIDEYHQMPVLELDSLDSATPGIFSYVAKSKLPGEKGAPEYICPTEIEPELERELLHISLQAHIALGALDISRVDIRLDAHGKPCLIEIKPIPGLTPGYSDICIQAEAEGIKH